MKCSFSIPGRWASALLVLMLVLASCSKEPLVAPVDAAAGTVKNTEGPGTDEPTPPTDGGYSSPKSGDEGEGEGGDISDDGDDISGSERNRKKTS
jgi:hypothetical protein